MTLMTLTILAASLFGVAEPVPSIPEPCRLSASAPWDSAGAGYKAVAITDGEVCSEASLTLALLSPKGRALYEQNYAGTAAVRRFYGVPGPAEMQIELESWIAPAEGKPSVSSALPAWPEAAAAPVGFEPALNMTAQSWAALLAAARPIFCFDDAPGYQTCVMLGADDAVTDIGRRATR